MTDRPSILLPLALVAVVFSTSAWVMMLAAGVIHSEVFAEWQPYGYWTALRLTLLVGGGMGAIKFVADFLTE